MNRYTRLSHMLLGEMHGPLDMRRVMERFWSPFCRQIVGPDLAAYRFKEVFDTIRTHDNDFTCQVNEHIGDATLIEDFFIILLCGFDIVSVDMGKSPAANVSGHPCNFTGTYTLAHTRPFLGWRPPSVSQSLSTAGCAKSGLSFGGNEEAVSMLERSDACTKSVLGMQLVNSSPQSPLVNVPFSARLEGSNHCVCHMILRSPALDVITGNKNCPNNVRMCLQNPDALRALVSLRRGNVRPDIITDKTLTAISAKKEAWCSALSIL